MLIKKPCLTIFLLLSLCICNIAQASHTEKHIEQDIGEGLLFIDTVNMSAKFHIKSYLMPNSYLMSSGEDWTVIKVNENLYNIKKAYWNFSYYINLINGEIHKGNIYESDKTIKKFANPLKIQVEKQVDKNGKIREILLYFSYVELSYNHSNGFIKIDDKESSTNLLWAYTRDKSYAVLKEDYGYSLRYNEWEEQLKLTLPRNGMARLVNKKVKKMMSQDQVTDDKKVSQESGNSSVKIKSTRNSGKRIPAFLKKHMGEIYNHPYNKRIAYLGSMEIFLNLDNLTAKLMCRDNKMNANDYVVKKITKDIYHINESRYNKNYWKVNLKNKTAAFNFVKNDGRTYAVPIQIEVDLKKKRLNKEFESASIEFPHTVMIEKKSGTFTIEALYPSTASYPDSLTIIENKRYDYDESTSLITDFFIKGNTALYYDKKNYIFTAKTISNTTSMKYATKIGGKITGKQLSEIKQAPSQWHDQEIEYYTKILSEKSYDYLVVPFESTANGIDRHGRYLMTRYLADDIERVLGVTVADIDLVSKALGSGLRTFNDRKVYELAYATKVKHIVRCNVSHDMKLGMTLTCKTYGRSANGKFNTKKAKIIKSKIIPFTDELPPSEKFVTKLPSLTKAISKTDYVPIKKSYFKVQNNITIPSGLKDFMDVNPQSILEEIYYLHLFGLLHPYNSYNRQSLFERSLVLLRYIDPKSPDYKVLKARALNNLYRRPAAIAALGTPSGTEEKLMYQLLLSNIPESSELIVKVESPIKRYMAKIEFAGMLFDENLTSNKETLLSKHASILKTDGEDFPLRKPYLQATIGQVYWQRIAANMVQADLAGMFPLKKIKSMAVFNSSGSSVEMQKYINDVYESYASQLSEDDVTARIKKIDFLNYFSDFAIYSAIGKIKMSAFYQGRGKESLKMFRNLEEVYGGNPQLSLLYRNIKTSSRRVNFLSNDNVKLYSPFDAIVILRHQEVSDLTWVYAHMAEQEILRNKLSVKSPNDVIRFAIKNDFPTHFSPWFLWSESIASDRSEYRLASKEDSNNKYEYKCYMGVKYDDSSELISSCLKLLKKPTKMKKFVYKQVRSRFKGHPSKASGLAVVYAGKGNDKKIIEHYEKTLESDPANIVVLKKLTLLYLKKLNLEGVESISDKFTKSAGNSFNRIGYNSHVGNIGGDLLKKGEVEISRKYIEAALKKRTGNLSQNFFAAVTATLDGNYNAALKYHEGNFRRYYLPKHNTETSGSLDEYLSYLSVFGFGEQLETIYADRPGVNSFEMADHPNRNPYKRVGLMSIYPLMRYYRQHGESDDEVGQKLASLLGTLGEKSRSYSNVEKDLYRFLIVDREVTTKSVNSFVANKNIRLNGAKTNKASEVLKAIASFKDGKYSEYLRVYAKHSDSSIVINYSKLLYPYAVASHVLINKASDLKNFNQDHKSHNKDFDTHLGNVVLHGLNKDYKKTKKSLTSARYSINSFLNHATKDWYAILEVLEFLYAKTGDKRYREEIIKWSRFMQQVYPYESFGYSFEVKYGYDKKAIIRALGFTLFLDKNSSRISHIPELEKKRAKKWFDSNNPFVEPNKFNKRKVLNAV